MADTTKSNRQTGRPKGSKTKAKKVDVEPTKCPSCGSTHRSRYVNVKTVHASGVTASGFAYRSITFRRCRCTTCGQVRQERHHNS